MIYLSAYGIQDYLDCSKKYFYRSSFPETGISTQEMALGAVVHRIIAEKWNDEVGSKELAFNLIEEYKIDKLEVKKLWRCLNNFYNIYAFMLRDNDKIEEKFTTRLQDNALLVGKIDRIIVSSGTIIDWKTSDRAPTSIDTDIQSILYYIAYKKLYGEVPYKLMVINLNVGQIINFTPKQIYMDTVMNEIIPKMIEQIKHKQFVREGLFNNSCRNCSYLTTCWNDRSL